MLRPEVRHIFRTERHTNFKHDTQIKYEDSYHRHDLQVPSSKVKVAMSHGASDRCWPISRERKVPETLKLVGRSLIPRAILRTSFRVKRSKVKVTRPINAHTVNAQYLPNRKSYKLYNCFTDGARRPVLPTSATSAVTSKVKAQGHKVTWSV